MRTVENAIDTAFDCTKGEIDLYRVQHGDKDRVLMEIEAHVNNPEAHKNI